MNGVNVDRQVSGEFVGAGAATIAISGTTGGGGTDVSEPIMVGMVDKKLSPNEVLKLTHQINSYFNLGIAV